MVAFTKDFAGVGWLFFCLTSRSTIFQSCWDGATASWVFTSTLGSLKSLSQGHDTSAVGFKPWTSRSRVLHSTTSRQPAPPPICWCVVMLIVDWITNFLTDILAKIWIYCVKSDVRFLILGENFLAEAIRTTVVPIRILIRTTVVPITPLIGMTVVRIRILIGTIEI